MNRKTEIEATLDRSLRSQVKVPRLDEKFDAGVWARIEAQAARAAAPAAVAVHVPSVARWLYIFNVIGLVGAGIFASVFAARMLAGIEISVSLPELSAAAREQIVAMMSLGLASAALIFGLMYTPAGRRLRAELS